jgi:hypothetical protein
MTALAVAATLVAGPAPSDAVAPVVLFFAKQMLKDMVTSSIKSALLGALSDSGCKGAALADTITSLAPGGGGVAGMLGGTIKGGASPLPTGAVMRPMPGGGMLPMPNAAGTGISQAEMAAMMSRVMPAGGLPPGIGVDPSQAAAMNQMLAAMNHPLSPAETLATMDEMAELGMLPKAAHAELKECMLLLPQSAQAMGMGMGMMKTMLPQMRKARDDMRALSPQEQDELAASLGEEFDKMPADDRKTMLGELGGGLFPPRVVESLSRRYP